MGEETLFYKGRFMGYQHQDIKPISDKAQYTDVYHTIMKAGEAWYRISGNIPKALLEVTRHIHGSINMAAYHAFKAMNGFDAEKKLLDIGLSQQEVFFLFSSLEYLCKTRAISPGAASTVTEVLHNAHEQLGKWYKSVQKAQKQESRLPASDLGTVSS